MRKLDSSPRTSGHLTDRRGPIPRASTDPPRRPPRRRHQSVPNEPPRHCRRCLADYWPSDAEFEGVRLVPGLCPRCSAERLAGWRP